MTTATTVQQGCDTAPHPDPDGVWLALSSRYTETIDALSGRDDLVVKVLPGAGRNAPGVFVPAERLIELDGAHLPDGVDPRSYDPRDPSHRRLAPVLHGIACHEAGHAGHTTWMTAGWSDGAGRAQRSAALLLEEPRQEARHLSGRPADRRWIRAAATALTVGAALPDTPWGAASALALVVGRVAGGTLDDTDGTEVERAVRAVVGDGTTDALLVILRRAVALGDGDLPGLLACAAEWCETVGVDPAGDSPDSGPDGSGGNGCGCAPDSGDDTEGGGAVAAAVASAAAEATGEELAELAEDDAAESAREREADARRASRSADAEVVVGSRRSASRVFAHGRTLGRSAARWTVRPPTPEERSAANRLATELRRARSRGVAETRTSSVLPPGRLRVRQALARDAQRAAGGVPTAEPWSATTRRETPEPPLSVGVVVDVSGSMQWAEKPVSSAAWVVGRAVGTVGGRCATVAFGSVVTPVVAPRQPLREVHEFRADDDTEEFVQAVDAADGALGLSSGDGARLLVVVSDGRYREDQRRVGGERIDRLRRSGCAVLWLTFADGSSSPLRGCEHVALTDPSAAGAEVGRAAVAALHAVR